MSPEPRGQWVLRWSSSKKRSFIIYIKNMQWIRRVYLYLVALISLVIIVIGSIQLINLGLKQWIFTKADQDFYSYPSSIDCASMSPEVKAKDISCSDPNFAAKEEQRQKNSREAQKQREAATAIAMIVVGSPVFYFHFKLARKEQ